MTIDEKAKATNSKEYKDLFLEINSILFDINVKTVLCPFLSMYSHVNLLDIHIAKTKENFHTRIYESKQVDLNNTKKLKEIIRELKGFLENEKYRY